MPFFVYRCPDTGYRVQGFIAEEVSDEDAFHAVECILCRRLHFVKPTTGEVAGEDGDA